jgi:hypothetical protein
LTPFINQTGVGQLGRICELARMMWQMHIIPLDLITPDKPDRGRSKEGFGLEMEWAAIRAENHIYRLFDVECSYRGSRLYCCEYNKS